MNVDDGSIRPWDSLTMEERSSGRWIKLTDDEFAMAERIDSPRRALSEMLRDIDIQTRAFDQSNEKVQE